MTLDAASEQRAKSLLLTVLDGGGSEAERAQLNQLLREDVDLRQSVVHFLCDSSYIADAIRTTDEAAALRQEMLLLATSSTPLPTGAIARAEGLSYSMTNGPREASFRGRAIKRVVSGIHFVDRHGLIIGAAASLLLGILGWQYISMLSKVNRLHAIAARPDPAGQQARQDAEIAKNSRASSSAARVTGVIDCEWPDGVSPLKFGDVLTPGDRLQLEKGLLQLTFDMGAKVVVEGPSDFVVASPNSATLDAGKIAAVVPPSGRGYTVLTPTAEVVDLGTEFGVTVNDEGASEVHVFEGDVVARSRQGGETSADLIHARVDEAIQFYVGNDAGRRMVADREKFVRRLTPAPSSQTLPQLPVGKDLVLWLAADIMQGMKEGAAVTTWPDILAGDNRFPDDAWQFDERRCPKWIRDGRGLPAVQFDGWTTYLATSPMATGNEITAFVAFAPGAVNFASELHGGMLLKFGPLTPSLEYSLMPDRRVKTRVWANDDSGVPSYASEVLSESIKPLEICASAYSYDVRKNRSELFLNGVSQGSSTAPRQLKQLARKYLGAHAEPWWEAYFLGSIYEVIVYDAVLSESDRNLVFEYLTSRYETPLSK